jgi:hypothetical protein
MNEPVEVIVSRVIFALLVSAYNKAASFFTFNQLTFFFFYRDHGTYVCLSYEK